MFTVRYTLTHPPLSFRPGLALRRVPQREPVHCSHVPRAHLRTVPGSHGPQTRHMDAAGVSPGAERLEAAALQVTPSQATNFRFVRAVL
jgi:hypothetical protein